ncbi:MAG: YidC/Oxa1 family insertase periplasmic-domain containing protein [Bacteroidetes bacterium]|nr:YidC/Oxa1 family insertase periplasmic-domain containing protein [Bacteroidota bacterium]
MAALKKQQDSIALIEKEVAAKASAQLKAATVAADSNLTAPAIPDSLNADSVNALLLSDKLGVFSAAGQGEEEIVSIENEVLKVNLTTRGGRIKSVELKQYKNFEGKPVRLLNPTLPGLD